MKVRYISQALLSPRFSLHCYRTHRPLMQNRRALIPFHTTLAFTFIFLCVSDALEKYIF